MTLNVFRFTGLNSALALKAPARCATTVNITLQGFQVVDGVSLQSTDTNLRVLVMNQVDARQNGLYDAQSGPWTRCADMDSNDDVVYDTRVNVQYGAVNQGQWALTAADPITLGTSNMTFSPAVIFEIAWGALPIMSDPDPVNDYLPIIDFDNPTVLARVAVGLVGVSFANPSASVGLSAVNGSASTAMRSDAAPALSQAIAPTWTGQHIFNNAITQLGATSQLQWSTDLILTRAAAATLQLGAADAASPVAQTLQVQSVVAGSSNTTGADFTIGLSKSTGQNDGGRLAITATPGGASGSSVNAVVSAYLTVDAANALSLGNAGNNCLFYVYNTRDAVGTKLTNWERLELKWPGNSNAYLVVTAAGSGQQRSLKVGGADTTLLYGVSATDAWRVESGNGHFFGVNDNTRDIGAVGANRPRNIYAGTLMQTPALRIDQAPTAVTSAGATISSAADGANNLGHRVSININGTTYWFPCGQTAF